MNVWLVMGGGLLAGVAVAVWWRLRGLAQRVEQCARRQYYGQSECQETARRHADALAVLRLQLAHLASGRTLDDALVRAGRLYHRMSAEEARHVVAAADEHHLVIVDVRSRKEFLEGHIPGARHLPLEHLETRARQDAPRDAGKILVYCSQGDRSRLACDFLSRQGYTNLVAMHDGFQHWKGPVDGAGTPTLVRIQPR